MVHKQENRPSNVQGGACRVSRELEVPRRRGSRATAAVAESADVGRRDDPSGDGGAIGREIGGSLPRARWGALHDNPSTQDTQTELWEVHYPWHPVDGELLIAGISWMSRSCYDALSCVI